MLRILVADDHDIFRRGLKNLLGSQPGWEVIGEAKTGEEAVARTTERKPDIVVIDINMPGLNGLEAAREIHKLFPKIGILILTVHFSDQLLTDVIEAGARGYVMKSDADRDLVRAVSALAATARGTFFTRCATEVLLNEYPSGKFGPGLQPPLRERLTTREREIVRLLAVGKNNREVGSLLGISIKTVQTHRANLMRKLEIHSTAEVVRYAVKNEIIEAQASALPHPLATERKLDWQKFDASQDAEQQANEIVRPGESYVIEPIVGECETCASLAPRIPLPAEQKKKAVNS